MKQKETSHLAIENNQLVETISLMSNNELNSILEHQSFDQDSLSIALCVALSDLSVDKTLTLLKAGADPNYQNGTPLISVARSVDSYEALNCIELLTEFGAQMDGTNGQNQALVTAIYEGNDKIAATILNNGGMDLKARGSEALCLAASEGNKYLTSIIARADSGQNFIEAFCLAAENGHHDVMSELGSYVGCQDIKHDALERAAFFGEFDSVKFMIDNLKMSVNKYDNSFLQTAIDTNNKEFAQYSIRNADRPLAIVQDPQIMQYIQREQPDLLPEVTKRMREVSIQESQMSTSTQQQNNSHQFNL